jgi:hypothetical protein
MKFILPESLHRIQLDPIEGEADILNVTVILTEKFEAWANEHGITDYEVEVIPESWEFFVCFASDTSGVMYRLSWSDLS